MEVLEYMILNEFLKVIENMCGVIDKILFFFIFFDYREVIYFNVYFFEFWI